MFKKEKGGIRGKLTPKVNNWPVWEVPALTKSFSTHGLQVFFFFFFSSLVYTAGKSDKIWHHLSYMPSF